MQQVTWRRQEIIMCVKVSCRLVFGMDHEGTNSCNICRLERSQHRVLHQRSAYSLILPISIDRQPCQQHDGNRMSGQPFLHSLRSLFLFHEADGQRVIAHDGVIHQTDVGLRSPTLLVLECVLVKKAIEFVPATIEHIHGVMPLKFFDRPGQRFTDGVDEGAASKNPGSVKRRCIRGRARVGASRAA